MKFASSIPLVVTAMAVGLVAPQTVAADNKAPSRPNVLFIAVDDLNDWIGCLGGHPDTKSPNIDALAKRGVLFERAYCAAPACNPSRAALMTGIAPYTSGVYHNDQPWRAAMPDAVTLPQLFMQHGYHAWGCGKIYHGRFPDPKSWEEYQPQFGDPQPKKRPVNGIRPGSHFDWGPVAAGDADMSDHRMVSWTIDKLKQKYDKPFFLACGIYRPHLPWYVPQEYFDQYPAHKVTLPKVKADDLDDVPAAGKKMARPQGDHRNVLAAKQWEEAVQGYLASITFADRQVGRLLDALDASDYAENTIIILWGDHGWHLGEKQHWRKFSLWEEADRAPLMMVVPGLTQAGGRCPRPVSFMDIYPTLADLCSLPIGKHLAGVPLRPLLKNPQAEWDCPAVTTHGRNNHAVRSQKWRYIRYHDGGEELYDHDRDENEWTNLAGQSQFANVKADLGKWLPKTNAEDADARQKKNRGNRRAEKVKK